MTMTDTAKKANVGVEHGRWGEDVAAWFLHRKGYVIIDRNVRPCRRDGRLEIDIIAYDRKLDLVVFVEVKQHSARNARQRLLRSVDSRKMALLRRACRTWLMANKWGGSYRFDVVEVYGAPGSSRDVEVDHVERVRLFGDPGRYVNWED